MSGKDVTGKGDFRVVPVDRASADAFHREQAERIAETFKKTGPVRTQAQMKAETDAAKAEKASQEERNKEYIKARDAQLAKLLERTPDETKKAELIAKEDAFRQKVGLVAKKPRASEMKAGLERTSSVTSVSSVEASPLAKSPVSRGR